MKRDKKDKKVLMIAYYFPPIKAMGSIRNFNIANEYKKYFGKVFVSTIKNNHIFAKDEEIEINSFEIVKNKSYDFRYVSSWVFPKERKSNSLIVKRIPRFIKKTLESFPINLLIGEGGLIYSLKSYNQCKKLIVENEINIIHSSFRPFSDHFVAYLLKRKFRYIQWIADFRDLQVEDVRKEVFFPQFQKLVTKRILKKATLVTTVSNGLAKHLKEFGKPVEVLRNGIPQREKKLLTPPKKFTISYTGSLYPKYQKIYPLLQAVSSLLDEKQINPKELELIYRGKDVDLWVKWLEEWNLIQLSNHGKLIPVSAARDLQRNSHINLLLSWASKEYTGILTGKLYEYMGAQSPILLIINGAEDKEFEQIFSKLSLGLVHYENDETEIIEKFILNHYQKWKQTGEISKIENEKLLETYSWNSLMFEFVKKIKTEN